MKNPLEAPVSRIVLFIGLSATLLTAQASRPPSPHPGPHPAPGTGGPSHNMVADSHFMARLFQIRAKRIQQVLGLPEDRARLVAERWGRWDREHMDRGDQAGALRQEFSQILMGPEKEEEKNVKLKPLLDQFMILRQQQEAGRKRFEEDIRVGLSPAQQARLILVMEEIQQRLREGLREVQSK